MVSRTGRCMSSDFFNNHVGKVSRVNDLVAAAIVVFLSSFCVAGLRAVKGVMCEAVVAPCCDEAGE